jgi:hypothetical protein
MTIIRRLGAASILSVLSLSAPSGARAETFECTAQYPCVDFQNDSTASNAGAFYAFTSNGVTASINSNTGIAIDATGGGDWSHPTIRASTWSTSAPAIHGTSANAATGVAGTSTATGYGVYGEALGGVGYGVYGYNDSTGYAIYGQNTTGGYAGYFRGNAYVTGNLSVGSLTNRSDARLKKDIQDLTTTTDQVMRLRPVTYRWKDGSGGDGVQVGLIAQEVRAVFPDLVREDARSGLLSVDYMALIPIVIKTVKDQQETIRQQERRLSALEAQRSPALSATPPGAWGVAAALGLLPVGLVVARRRRPAPRARA